MTQSKRKAKPRRSDEENARIHGRGGRVVRAIEEFNAALPAAARAAKYTKMAESPYVLYRGTNHLFWQDFEWDWRLDRFGSYRTRTWLNGDCHAYNFGAYDVRYDTEDPAKVRVIYGLNDFDEAIVGDYQYDLWRLAVSLVLIATTPTSPLLSRESTERVIDAVAQTYLDTLRGFRGNDDAHEAYYSAEHDTYSRLKKFLGKVEKKKSRGKLLDKWTTEVDGETRFDVEMPRLEPVTRAQRAKVEKAIPAYVETIRSGYDFSAGFFRVKDVAKRLGAGTGSLGSARYYVLLEGDEGSGMDDVILDVKHQAPPSAYPYASEEQMALYRGLFPNEGIRHQQAYLALGYHPDRLLGWLELDGKVFSVRERSPYKESFPAEEELTSEKRFVRMAEQWGRGLATEHARADGIMDYSLSEEVAELVGEQDGEFRRVVREVAFGYAAQVESDWETFVRDLAPEGK